MFFAAGDKFEAVAIFPPFVENIIGDLISMAIVYNNNTTIIETIIGDYIITRVF